MKTIYTEDIVRALLSHKDVVHRLIAGEEILTTTGKIWTSVGIKKELEIIAIYIKLAEEDAVTMLRDYIISAQLLNVKLYNGIMQLLGLGADTCTLDLKYGFGPFPDNSLYHRVLEAKAEKKVVKNQLSTLTLPLQGDFKKEARKKAVWFIKNEIAKLSEQQKFFKQHRSTVAVEDKIAITRAKLRMLHSILKNNGFANCTFSRCNRLTPVSSIKNKHYNNYLKMVNSKLQSININLAMKEFNASQSGALLKELTKDKK